MTIVINKVKYTINKVYGTFHCDIWMWDRKIASLVIPKFTRKYCRTVIKQLIK